MTLPISFAGGNRPGRAAGPPESLFPALTGPGVSAIECRQPGGAPRFADSVTPGTQKSADSQLHQENSG
jgi:hypothetical protein